MAKMKFRVVNYVKDDDDGEKVYTSHTIQTKKKGGKWEDIPVIERLDPDYNDQIRAELGDIIEMLSPSETPFFDKWRDLHKWNTDPLSEKKNKSRDGAEYLGSDNCLERWLRDN